MFIFICITIHFKNSTLYIYHRKKHIINSMVYFEKIFTGLLNAQRQLMYMPIYIYKAITDLPFLYILK